jgi:zinc transport system substrate-binding protein
MTPPASRRRQEVGRLGLALLTLLVALTACQRVGDAPASSPPRKPLVIATFYPLYEFARQVGGDLVEVAALVPPGVEAHHWEPTPSQLARLRQARVFVYNGAGLEPWVGRLLGEILPREAVAVSATDGLPLVPVDLPLPQVRPWHVVGRPPDPHVWLDPRLAAAQVERIAAALAGADPARAPDYAANARRYTDELDALHQAFEAGLATCRRREFLVSHAAFGYLARRYGLTQVSVMGFAPEAEPSPAGMAGAVRFMRGRDVTHVFFEPLASRKLADTLAREAGVTALALHPVEGLTREQVTSGQSYVTLMEANLANLRLGLGCR